MFLDTRIQRAISILDQGHIKVLSLDIFDTLIARRVPAPPDVFLRMGIILKERGQLRPGIKPDSFAAIRYQIEYAARGKRQEAHGDREITIHEIYDMFPPHIVVDTINTQDLVRLELQTESELVFANREMIELAKRAKENGILLALISNTYIPQKNLTPFIFEQAPDLPTPDKIYISCDHRMGKRTGLMKRMCADFNIDPANILHIGDNPISDKMAAEETGLTFIDYGACPTGFDKTLNDEHPRQWFARTGCFADMGGDFGLTWLRKQSSFWKLPNDVQEDHSAFYRYGTRLLGPLLAGFTGWAAQRMKQEHGATLFGLLREGDLLTRLVRLHAPDLNCSLLPASRMSVALATFTPDHPDYLEEFLTRRAAWTVEALLEQLGFDRMRAQEICTPHTMLSDITPKELTKRIMSSSLANELFQKSAARRSRLLTQLRTCGALSAPKLYLFDLGYAASIQRYLQRVFTIEKIPVVTHGLYAVAVHVSLGTQREGGIVEGFMAQNGNPNDFSCAYGRSPEVVELFCLPPYGSVRDYEADGSPLFDKETRSERQILETDAAQKGILDFTQAFVPLAQTAPIRPSFTSEAWAQQMRNLALRIIVHPTTEEVQTIGHWVTDSEMGVSAPRALLSTGDYQDAYASMAATELAILPRRDVPWLFGVAASLSYAKNRQIAQLIMRQENEDAFKPN